MTKFIIFLLLLAILYAVYKYQEQYNLQKELGKEKRKGKRKYVEIVEPIAEEDNSLGSLVEGDFNELGSLIETNDIGSNDSLLDL